MRKFLFTIFLCPLLVFSQNDDHFVIAAQGDVFTTDNISISWTLGEVFTESTIQSNGTLTQGFHQSWLNNSFVVSESDEESESNENVENSNPVFFETDNLNFNIYPNPSDGIFNLEVLGNLEQFIIEIYDSSGRLVLDDLINSSLSQINLSSYENGLYNLIIREKDTDNISSARLIKL